MKVEIHHMEGSETTGIRMPSGASKFRALVETGWFWKKRRWVYGDGTVWHWHTTGRRCPEWLELKLWIEWSKLIGNQGEKNARSIEH